MVNNEIVLNVFMTVIVSGNGKGLLNAAEVRETSTLMQPAFLCSFYGFFFSFLIFFFFFLFSTPRRKKREERAESLMECAKETGSYKRKSASRHPRSVS